MMKRFALLLAGFALVLTMATEAVADGSEPVIPPRARLRASGASTIAPFAALVAQRFPERTDLPRPIWEITGTNGGIQLFCAGVGLLHPDISLATRLLRADEKKRCGANGVTEIASIKIGFDALAIVARRDMPKFGLSRRELWLAIAATVPVGGRLAANPYRRWNEISPRLPDLPITVIGPHDTSGRLDTVQSLVMEPPCRAAPEITAIADAGQRREACTTLRTDGVYVATPLHRGVATRSTEKLLSLEAPALSFTGLEELDDSPDRLAPLAVDGVMPEAAEIAKGTYPISRLLYLHVKVQNMPLVKGVRAFTEEFLSPEASGPEGYLTSAGLVPLAPADRAAALQTLAAEGRTKP